MTPGSTAHNFRHILIIADIEGSSGCWSYRGSSFMTRQWRHACYDMTADVNGVVDALFDAGVRRITVKDFHRTGYNILPERINPKATVVSGYRPGPVPGLGDPGDAEGVMLLGMHAASGTPGFLAHTLTSRIKRLEVNGEPMAEVALFCASLAPFGVRPIFFSGCPVACRQAASAVKGIHCFPIDKTDGPKTFDAVSWRAGFANAARASLKNAYTKPYVPEGPFEAVVTLRDGEPAAKKIADRWHIEQNGPDLYLHAPTIHTLYDQLIRICYLTPGIEKILPAALLLYHLIGRFGQGWVRRSALNDGMPHSGS
jgi:D-amino peptidase